MPWGRSPRKTRKCRLLSAWCRAGAQQTVWNIIIQTVRLGKECDWSGESFRDACPEGRVRTNCTGESKVVEEWGDGGRMF